MERSNPHNRAKHYQRGREHRTRGIDRTNQLRQLWQSQEYWAGYYSIAQASNVDYGALDQF